MGPFWVEESKANKRSKKVPSSGFTLENPRLLFRSTSHWSSLNQVDHMREKARNSSVVPPVPDLDLLHIALRFHQSLTFPNLLNFLLCQLANLLQAFQVFSKVDFLPCHSLFHFFAGLLVRKTQLMKYHLLSLWNIYCILNWYSLK